MDSASTPLIVLVTNVDVLSKKIIINVRRSGDSGEGLSVKLHFATPQHKLDELEARAKEYALNLPAQIVGVSMNISEQDTQSEMILCNFWLNHKGNWQDNGRRVRNRSAFYRFLIQTIVDLKIDYRAPKERYLLPGQSPTDIEATGIPYQESNSRSQTPMG